MIFILVRLITQITSNFQSTDCVSLCRLLLLQVINRVLFEMKSFFVNNPSIIWTLSHSWLKTQVFFLEYNYS